MYGYFWDFYKFTFPESKLGLQTEKGISYFLYGRFSHPNATETLRGSLYTIFSTHNDLLFYTTVCQLCSSLKVCAFLRHSLFEEKAKGCSTLS